MADISKLNINGTTYNLKDTSKIPEAPSDDNFYVRQNNAWASITIGTEELTAGTSSLNGIYLQYE